MAQGTTKRSRRSRQTHHKRRHPELHRPAAARRPLIEPENVPVAQHSLSDSHQAKLVNELRLATGPATAPIVVTEARPMPDGRPANTEQPATDLALPIEELDLTVRAYNKLKREGVNSIGDLVAKTEGDLWAIEQLGEKLIAETKSKLAGMGLTLRDSEKPAV